VEQLIRTFKSFAEADAADRQYRRSLRPQQRMEFFYEFQRLHGDPPLDYKEIVAVLTARSTGG
jgi:hypothetical protein